MKNFKNFLFEQCFLLEGKKTGKNPIIPSGHFYTFNYDAKGYEEGTLNYFDKNPLIICLDSDDDYLLGFI